MKITDKITFNSKRQILMAGNCVLENKAIAFQTAEYLKKLSEELDVDFIFKASYRKDNRSSEKYFSGLPLDEALRIFDDIKKEFDLPIVSDVHYPHELDEGVADVLDVLQIPAYLAMQTELVTKVAKTGKCVNIKKPQFLHPDDMAKICKKAESTGNRNLMLTERGTCFGYRDLMVDIRSFAMMQSTGYPVIFDAGHSIRKYGIPSSDPTGGNKQFLNHLMSACAATNINGLFIEVHPDPKNALCDAASQLSFDEAKRLLKKYFSIAKYVQELG